MAYHIGEIVQGTVTGIQPYGALYNSMITRRD